MLKMIKEYSSLSCACYRLQLILTPWFVDEASWNLALFLWSVLKNILRLLQRLVHIVNESMKTR